MIARGTFAFLLATACAGGCAALPPARGQRISIGARRLYLAPVRDETGALDPRERAWLRGAVALGLLDMTEKRPGRAKGRGRAEAERATFEVAHAPGEADMVLEVDIERLREPCAALALFVGLGAGRPGYAAEVRLLLPRAPAGAAVDRARIEETSSRFSREPGGAREAMLRDLAAEAVRFVRARR
jgi:hypothetical protein